MTNENKTVLITGATGKQGGAVARELLTKGWKVRAMTRHPDSDTARGLVLAGAEVVQADLDDEDSLARAHAGMWGVFAVQNTWEAGVAREEEQGKRQARVARAAGVQHFVYSSVGSAHKNTGIPHFENKWRVEQTIRSLEFPSYAIIRPVFFMENLLSPWFLQGDTINAALSPTTILQMIAVEDVGKYGALAFDLRGEELDIAGDALSIPEAASQLSEATGRSIGFQQIPIEAVRQNSEDFALMLEWFERVGYSADIEGNTRKTGIKPTRFMDWARKHAPRK